MLLDRQPYPMLHLLVRGAGYTELFCQLINDFWILADPIVQFVVVDMRVRVDNAGHHHPAFRVDAVGIRPGQVQYAGISSNRLNFAVPNRYRFRRCSPRCVYAEGGVVHRNYLAVVDH